MPIREVLVLCGGLKAEPQLGGSVLELDVNGSGSSRVNLDSDTFYRAILAELPDYVSDLVEIACYVFCADQFTRRDTPEMHRFGDTWRRSFRFRVPVADIRMWERGDVVNQLISTLSFLSEDAYMFEFEERPRPPRPDRHLDFSSDPSISGFVPDRVMLFSGGLDLLAGAAAAIVERNERVALVSHRASTMIAARQGALVQALKHRAGSTRVFHLAVGVNKGGEPAAEYTQRSRSFLFAVLAFACARAFDQSEIDFAENGVISLNLPIAPHVLGARSTRTTHPRALADMGRLFSLLSGSDFRVRNPLFWLTKTEVISRLVQARSADLIASSFSCSRVGLRSRRKRHCGICSQCIDRRFAVLAAGLEEFEPADIYAVDLFAGKRKLGPHVTLANSYILAARNFATMTEAAFSGRYGEIFRAVRFIEGTAVDVIPRLLDLHRRHGRAVVGVVDQALVRAANLEAVLNRDYTSLLSIIRSPETNAPVLDASELEPSASEQAAAMEFPPVQPPVPFAIEHEGQRVLFRDGVELVGVLAKLFAALAERFEEDLRSNRADDEYRPMLAPELGDRIAVQEATVRKYITSARKSLIEQFRMKARVSLGEEDHRERSRTRLQAQFELSGNLPKSSTGRPRLEQGSRKRPLEVPQVQQRDLDSTAASTSSHTQRR